eukprot:CAMPEP_0179216728 /NCGR_PEP_ID=MMETSP0797-20121207/3536_1 /TAXON_ID=47934 /ORGANISM="Dinophysis acuminata, Strain DAEP01" /LENGTH=108 /DNA_ID=CAMNT_0020922911 /DNA_START=70 /DNA_END=396 /DNA_ORIENTATION=-
MLAGILFFTTFSGPVVADGSCTGGTQAAEVRLAEELGAGYLEQKKNEYEAEKLQGSSLIQLGTGTQKRAGVTKRAGLERDDGSGQDHGLGRPPVFNPFKPDPVLAARR